MSLKTFIDSYFNLNENDVARYKRGKKIYLMISFRKTISNLRTGANFTYTDEFKRKGILFKCNTT